LAIYEGWLSFQEMQIDRQTFPINVLDSKEKKVLVRLNVVDEGKGKSVVIGDP
jgi:hypothetical protein